MKPAVRSRFKPDAVTLVLGAVLAVAAVWLLVDQVVGARNPLLDRLFGFALGFNLGNVLRIELNARRRDS